VLVTICLCLWFVVSALDTISWAIQRQENYTVDTDIDNLYLALDDMGERISIVSNTEAVDYEFLGNKFLEIYDRISVLEQLKN
jgi:hypothetical protein